MSEKSTLRRIRIRHRGRGSQVFIYFGKLLRMFVYQNDWKVLPMAALIAGLVGMVIRKRMLINMEGCLMGSFALVCVCIWNGCFNSIQVICRERDVIKREHRSGMHISSYVFSHMLYQALLCLMQTGVTIYVSRMAGVRYDLGKPLITNWFMLDLGISMFLITYASDMLSLWVSTLAKTTTAAMTIMPFVLIFQLVFSGGMLALPEWSKPLTSLTISNPGLKVIATQADYNNQPLVTIWNTLQKMENSEVGGTVTVGQVLDLLSDNGNSFIRDLRSRTIGGIFTVGELTSALEESDSYKAIQSESIVPTLTVRKLLESLMGLEDVQPYLEKQLVPGFTAGGFIKAALKNKDMQDILDKPLTPSITVGDVVDRVKSSGILDRYRDMQFGTVTTVGELVDKLASFPLVNAYREKGITLKTTLGKIISAIGPEKVKSVIQAKAAEASYNKDYEFSPYNVVEYWFDLFLFVLLFGFLSTLTLEFVDKDKR